MANMAVAKQICKINALLPTLKVSSSRSAVLLALGWMYRTVLHHTWSGSANKL